MRFYYPEIRHKEILDCTVLCKANYEHVFLHNTYSNRETWSCLII